MNELFEGLVHRSTLVIAHRGARSLAPENTLAAAKRALQAGADMWELDLRMTADGHAVVIHDATLNRTSNAPLAYPARSPWRVCDFTLEDLRRLDFGSWFQEADPHGQIVCGAVDGADLAGYRGQGLLTLTEALDFTTESGMAVNLELKDLSGTGGHGMIVDRVVRAIEEKDMADRVIVSSFHHDYLKESKRRNPSIRTGVLVRAPRRNPLKLMESLRADAYHPRFGTITLDGISKLQRQGVPVFIWVVNEAKAMENLIEAGVSGIFTDFPQTLASLLGTSPRPQGPPPASSGVPRHKG